MHRATFFWRHEFYHRGPTTNDFHNNKFVADADGDTLLSYAASIERWDLVEIAMQHCTAKTVNDRGYTPLIYVARAGHIEMAEAILRHIEHDRSGFRDSPIGTINFYAESGFTALNHAIMEGQLEMARFLISRGADVNIGGNWSPLESACTLIGFDSRADERRAEFVEFLLQCGADVFDGIDGETWSALFLAKEFEHLDVVDILERHIAEVEEIAMRLTRRNDAYVGDHIMGFLRRVP